MIQSKSLKLFKDETNQKTILKINTVKQFNN